MALYILRSPLFTQLVLVDYRFDDLRYQRKTFLPFLGKNVSIFIRDIELYRIEINAIGRLSKDHILINCGYVFFQFFIFRLKILALLGHDNHCFFISLNLLLKDFYIVPIFFNFIFELFSQGYYAKFSRFFELDELQFFRIKLTKKIRIFLLILYI
jgi:hypothetical protein